MTILKILQNLKVFRRGLVTNDLVLRECRFQHPTNRQMSVGLTEYDDEEQIEIDESFRELQEELIKKQVEYYEYCIENKIAKEQARCILSEGLTKTRLYMNGTLRSWIHYVKIRSDLNTTQKEHCDVCLKIVGEIEKVFPMIRKFVCDEQKSSVPIPKEIPDVKTVPQEDGEACNKIISCVIC
jgi:thymidylate synthase (FAD)